MLANIQFLRAFAALNVVLFHIIGAAGPYGAGTMFLRPLAGWGASGVDIFFVISGFVMVYIQRRNPRSPFAFLQGRLWRIVPDYWILTLLLAGLYAAAPNAIANPVIQLDWLVASLFFVSALVFDGRWPMLYVGWTLEFEMLFYVIFAACLLFGNASIQRLIVFAALILLVVLGLNLMAIEFLFGMGVAIVLEKVTVPRGALITVGLLGIVGLCASLFFHPGVHRVIMWGIPAALIVFASAALPQFRCRPLEYLGDASYDIYLVQVFTIPATYRLSSSLLAFMPPDAIALLCLAVTAAAGCVLFWLLGYVRQSWGPARPVRRPI